MNMKQQSNKYPFSAEREDRVAAALRENLRKRKAAQQHKQHENAEESSVED